MAVGQHVGVTNQGGVLYHKGVVFSHDVVALDNSHVVDKDVADFSKARLTKIYPNIVTRATMAPHLWC